jgi:CPA1 family monovalent cation:H+ antiporter
VWDTLIFLLNGVIFVLIGLQLPTITQGLKGNYDWPTLLGWAAATCGVAILVRVVYVFLLAYLPRMIPAVGRRDPMPPWKNIAVVSWCGMRGIVTLAAAMALPIEFPYRGEIIFLAFACILATLVFQGLSLAPIIRLFGLADDGVLKKEELEARREAVHAALARLEVMSFEASIPPDVIHRVREEYSERLTIMQRSTDGVDGRVENCPVYLLNRTKLEALVAERRMITLLRDQNIIGDEALRRLIVEIDMEEAKLR